MAVNNNLYPPIIDSYMPAFIRDSGCTIEFKLSAYNSIDTINKQLVQIVVHSQENNSSVLDTKKYPSGIMIKEMIAKTDAKDTYLIRIDNSDINQGFQLNKYYKVQIRFTKAGTAFPPQMNINDNKPELGTYYQLDKWLIENLNNFSEWSTVCLIRGISKPTLVIKQNPEGENQQNVILLSSGNVSINGYLTFEDSEENERLKSYTLEARTSAGELIIKTDNIYNNIYSDKNEINYTFDYLFTDGEQYEITIEYLTNDLYYGKQTFRIMSLGGSSEKLDATLSVKSDIENARFAVRLLGYTPDEKYTKNVIIRRADSKTNFTV